MSNEAHSLTKNLQGITSTGSGTDIKVFQGTKELSVNISASNAGDLNNNEFLVDIQDVDQVTEGSISAFIDGYAYVTRNQDLLDFYNNNNQWAGNPVQNLTIIEFGEAHAAAFPNSAHTKYYFARVADHDFGSFTGQSATITYTITFKNDVGETGTITKQQTFSISEQGVGGPKGNKGVGVVFRGLWAPNKIYTGATETSDRGDVVYYPHGNSKYWIAQATHRSSASFANDEAADNWKPFGAEFESVATDLLLAKDAVITHTLTMGEGDINDGTEYVGHGGLIKTVGKEFGNGVTGFFLGNTGNPPNPQFDVGGESSFIRFDGDSDRVEIKGSLIINSRDDTDLNINSTDGEDATFIGGGYNNSITGGRLFDKYVDFYDGQNGIANVLDLFNNDNPRGLSKVDFGHFHYFDEGQDAGLEVPSGPGIGSAIVGGGENNISGRFSFIGAGFDNNLGDNFSAIVAGYNNQMPNLETGNAGGNFIGAGVLNVVDGGSSQSVCNGKFNEIIYSPELYLGEIVPEDQTNLVFNDNMDLLGDKYFAFDPKDGVYPIEDFIIGDSSLSSVVPGDKLIHLAFKCLLYREANSVEITKYRKFGNVQAMVDDIKTGDLEDEYNNTFPYDGTFPDQLGRESRIGSLPVIQMILADSSKDLQDPLCIIGSRIAEKFHVPRDFLSGVRSVALGSFAILENPFYTGDGDLTCFFTSNSKYYDSSSEFGYWVYVVEQTAINGWVYISPSYNSEGIWVYIESDGWIFIFNSEAINLSYGAYQRLDNGTNYKLSDGSVIP